MSYLDEYYQKFNEDKRLDRRHGQVEFRTSMKYVLEVLKNYSSPRIADIGAGTGKYSLALAKLGYSVTAVEPVQKNLNVLRSKNTTVNTFLGNALDLNMLKDETFDLTIFFGPMYHLHTEAEKEKALSEAKRITKKNGIIMVAYYMNEYAVLIHGFRDNYIKESIKNKKLDENFHVISSPEDIYSMDRIEDIKRYAKNNSLERIKMIASDGPSDYMRHVLNEMDNDTFELYMKYHFATCERNELLGASSHIVDILKK